MAKKTVTRKKSKRNVIRYVPALLLATVAAAFAISGLPAMFPGSPYGAVALGIAIEVGTLYAFHVLHKSAGWHKIAILAVALVACSLNALGVYGYLTRAHVQHAAEQSVASEIQAQENLIAEIDRRLTPTTSTTEVVKKGKRTTVTSPNKIDPKQVEKLEAERAEHLATLTGLRKRQEMNEAEIGPARYLAELIGKSADATMELVIVAFVLVLQPFAIVLLWAANGREEKKPESSTKRKVVRKKAKRKPAKPKAVNDNVIPFKRG